MKIYSLAYLIAIATCSLALATVGCGSSAQKADAAADAGNGGSGGSGGSNATGGSNGSGGSNATGGAGSGTCGQVLPCGGSLLGSWRLTETCADLATQTSPTCPDERITSWTPTVSGNWTFNADMTYSRSTIASVVVVWNIPLSCVAALASSCADLAAQTQASLAPGETITCTGSSTCLCTETAGPRSTSDNGTYQTAGTNITYTSAVTGSTTTGSYCVQGSRLHLVTLDIRAANGVGSDVVGEKP